MLRGYALHSRRSAASSQEEALKAAGVTVVYMEGRGAEAFDTLLKSLRKGEAVAVVRLADLAANRKQFRERWKAVHAKGCFVVEQSTGRRSNTKMRDDMLFDGTEALVHAGKGHDPEKAREFGLRGGRPRKDRGISDAEAEKHWFDMRHATNADALKHMGKFNEQTAQRRFGPSGRQTGPRRKLKSKPKR